MGYNVAKLLFEGTEENTESPQSIQQVTCLNIE
jgi:hypothetical protein